MTKNFDDTSDGPEEETGLDKLSRFLNDLALIADTDSGSQETSEVTLMTLHAAKGLEFPVVFLIGMEENVFPLSRAAEDQDELEEERRLAYVGITRAEKILYLPMPTRACFLVVPTTTVRLVLLTKSVQICLSIKVWPVQPIQALRHLIAVVALPSVKV